MMTSNPRLHSAEAQPPNTPIGRSAAVFIYRSIRRDLLLVALAALVLQFGWQRIDLKRDETDPPFPGPRSGLKLFTDHGTGCQYLLAEGTAELRPRLNAQGQHLCKHRTPTPTPSVVPVSTHQASPLL